MTVINLKKEDCAFITEFFNENFKDGWTKEMLLSAFDSGRFYALAAESDEKIVGVITYSLAIDSADIEDVVVALDKRKQGVASALIEKALLDIKNSNIEKVFLEVRETNEAAVCAYQKFGFKNISVRKKYYADGENALVMLKEF